MTSTIKNLKIKKEQFITWLNTAIPFSVWRWSNKKHIIEARDFIAKEIGEKYRTSRDKAKDDDMLMNFLLNLWVGFCTGCPIRISMNTSKYSKNSAYGKVFFTYKRTRRILEALERHGFLQRVPGYYFIQDTKETRIWGTEKLIRLFVDYFDFKPIGDVITLKREDLNLVQLREEKIKRIEDKKKPGKTKPIKYFKPVDYENTESTIAMEDNIKKYNTLAQAQTITVKLDQTDLISSTELIDEIFQGLATGTIKLTESTLLFKEPYSSSDSIDSPVLSDSVDSPVLSVCTHVPGLQISSISYKKYSIPTLQDKDDAGVLMDIESLLLCVTNTLQSQQWQYFQPETVFFLYLFYLKKMFSLIKFTGRNKKARDAKRDKMLKQKRTLADFGIKSLEFEINKKSLHRVFNRGSKAFDKGGRFYGPSYQGMGKDIRKSILINGHETVELDFSGLHIRMLYHDLKQELNEDPYLIGNNSHRAEYKLVSLISINAKRQGAHIAVRDALKQGGFKIADDLKQVTALMKNYQERHEPIKKFLFSGAGIDLQNKDSQIMEKILMRLHDQGICGLPIHDSVLVEKKYADLLYDIMMKAYEEVMDGFKPVLKIAS